jgi:hypothetical protein
MKCPASHEARGPRPKLELGELFRQHGDRLWIRSGQQARVVRALSSCRTAALGGHVRKCDQCGHRERSYNSCRNRHCPKCQGLDEVRWLRAQEALLLPIAYHHVVFTIPESLHRLFLDRPRLGYSLLFAAVSETLREVALRPSNLGARIGFTAVLHTWTQTLTFHPHLHCVVTGGGLHPDGQRWVSAKPRFLFAVCILSRLFRGKLLGRLERALEQGEFRLPEREGRDDLRAAARKEWNVYSKPPFAGPQSVLRYLARYTHRIAISNHRLVAHRNGKVTFRWRDRADADRPKNMTLQAEEFLRRFLLHVLPAGFMRVRHYGLLANASRKESLETCRALLGAQPVPKEPTAPETWQALFEKVTGRDPMRCPKCGLGQLVICDPLEPQIGRGRAPPGEAPA